MPPFVFKPKLICVLRNSLLIVLPNGSYRSTVLDAVRSQTLIDIFLGSLQNCIGMGIPQHEVMAVKKRNSWDTLLGFFCLPWKGRLELLDALK